MTRISDMKAHAVNCFGDRLRKAAERPGLLPVDDIANTIDADAQHLVEQLDSSWRSFLDERMTKLRMRLLVLADHWYPPMHLSMEECAAELRATVEDLVADIERRTQAEVAGSGNNERHEIDRQKEPATPWPKLAVLPRVIDGDLRPTIMVWSDELPRFLTPDEAIALVRQVSVESPPAEWRRIGAEEERNAIVLWLRDLGAISGSASFARFIQDGEHRGGRQP